MPDKPDVYVATDRAGHLLPIGYAETRRDMILKVRKYAHDSCGSNMATQCAFMRQHRVTRLENVGKMQRRRQKGRNTRRRKVFGVGQSGRLVLTGIELV